MNINDANNLMLRGAVALAEVEANGMRIDVGYLDQIMEKTDKRIQKLEKRLRGCEEYKKQRRRYGVKCNLNSRDQLGAVLFNDYGHKPLAFTDTGRPKLDETQLEAIGTKYATKFLLLEKLNKLNGTYLKAVRREVEGEYLHAFFGLHLVRSYRGQSDSPNLQNIPVRDPVQGPVIRRAFIPRDGHAIVDIDYTSLEVMVACALSGDPKLTYDAVEGDMHRDMAAECFLLEKDNVSKGLRQATKGGFVFAEFYGDWYKQVTKNLWDAIDRNGLETAEGVPLHEHLASKGIKGRGACKNDQDARPGTFEHHIKKTEDSFWNKRFKVYHARRKKWVAEYNKNGYIDTATGFRCQGPMSKNQVMNYHIQGPAFHCLLWSLTEIIRLMKKQRMGGFVISQIHDSIIADIPIDEVPAYLRLAREVMTERIKKAMPWLAGVQLRVEAEVATANWHEKKEVEIL